jgi:parallel beta-helix repeat protein
MLLFLVVLAPMLPTHAAGPDELLSSWAAGLVPAGMPPTAYVPHAPILINSDVEFLLPSNGVVAGSGTADDPYIIRGWAIAAASEPASNAISIKNTRKHVVVTDNHLASIANWGIRVENVENLRIASNVIYGIGGIGGASSRQLTVLGNEVTAANSGIVIVQVADTRADSNRVSCATFAALAASGTNISIVGNTLSCSDGTALQIEGGTDIRALGNLLTDSADAAWVDDTSGLDFVGNVVSGNDRGVNLDDLHDFDIRENYAHDNGKTAFSLWIRNDSPRGAFVNNTVERTDRALDLLGYPKPFNVAWSGNSVDGRPALLFEGLRDAAIDGGGARAAFLMVVDSENTTLRNWVVDESAYAAVQIIGGERVTARDMVLNHTNLVVAYGKDHVVESNTFTNGSSPPITVWSEGTRLLRNVITGAGIGIDMDIPSPEKAGPARGPGAPKDIHILDNNVSVLWAALRAWYVDGMEVRGNTFDSGDTGVYLRGSSGVTINHNTITGDLQSLTRSHWTEADGMVDGRWNWWGSPDGPNPSNGQEAGVNYVPWLDAPLAPSS